MKEIRTNNAEIMRGFVCLLHLCVLPVLSRFCLLGQMLPQSLPLLSSTSIQEACRVPQSLPLVNTHPSFGFTSSIFVALLLPLRMQASRTTI